MLRFLENGTSLTIDAKEYLYPASSGNATIIPINESWTKIGILVSGGLDSALLTYLTAKTIKDNGLQVKIKPISLEVASKAKTLSSARNVIKFISEKLDFDQWEPVHEAYVPIEESYPPNKGEFFLKVIREVFANQCNFILNGDTKNPPDEVRSSFKYNDYRELHRDNRTTIYNGQWSASPHIFMDKKDILELYIKYDLLGMTPYTLSCDENMDKILKFNYSIPCRECWWCLERQWGFESNNLTKEMAYEYTK